MNELFMDIEMFSSVDLGKCGVYKYAASPDFEILLFAYSVDGGEVKVVDIASGEDIPDEILAALEDDEVTKWSYNVNFERVCLSSYLNYPVGRYLSPFSWRCSMIWAAYLGLPQSLAGAGAVLQVDKKKLEEGKDLIKYFCVPCKGTKSNNNRTRNRPEDAPEKKTFAAAVARIYHPGMKFDSVLVFDGEQGIGKSTLFKELAGEDYYSDTLSLTDMNDKSGAEKLQGFWVVEIAELAGMKKADIEKVKAFLSTSDDKYRPSYGHTVESHPRQGIIIASVNGERGYLRDITGNRRFWVVKLLRKGQKKDWKLDRDQIWAEAKAIWESGEKLYLEGDMVVRADEAQKGAMEEDERKGMVEEYLNTLLPAGWDGMDLFARRNYLSEKDAPTSAKGVIKRQEVSNLEIWSECFGRNSADMRPADSYSIAALMMQIPGWERTNRSRKLAIYGKQRLYERTGTEEEKK